PRISVQLGNVCRRQFRIAHLDSRNRYNSKPVDAPISAINHPTSIEPKINTNKSEPIKLVSDSLATTELMMIAKASQAATDTRAPRKIASPAFVVLFGLKM